MAGGGKNQEGGSQSEAVVFVVFAVICLLAWSSWTFMRAVIVMPAFALDYAFIFIIEHTRGLGETGQAIKAYIEDFFNGTYDASTDINWTNFYTVRDMVGSQVRLFISAIILGLGVWAFIYMKGDGFKRMFSLAGGKGQPMSLAEYQARTWKVATYSSQFTPDAGDAATAPALTPLEWLRTNKIVFENDTYEDEEKAAKAFEVQLGQQWRGFKRASLYGRAVAVLCGLHYMSSHEKFRHIRKVAQLEREQLNIAFAGGKDGSKAALELIERYQDESKPDNRKLMKLIDAVGKRHGFENTALIDLLDKARAKSGVLSSSDFAYLKRVDRHLWYALNNVGRRRYHVEGAGAIAHYKAEMVMEKPLHEPHVQQAVAGVETYMHEQGIDSMTYFDSIKSDDILLDDE